MLRAVVDAVGSWSTVVGTPVEPMWLEVRTFQERGSIVRVHRDTATFSSPWLTVELRPPVEQATWNGRTQKYRLDGFIVEKVFFVRWEWLKMSIVANDQLQRRMRLYLNILCLSCLDRPKNVVK